MRQKHPHFWFQLTALWAFVEVTLGGMLHAIRVPLTGVVVGGTAVAIISIIGRSSENPWKDILRATSLVIIVKAGASPHSPLPAYLAVAFQGLLGAVIFQVFKFCKASVVLFSVSAMLESALQKLILMTVLYGKSLWIAIDIFVKTTLQSFHVESVTSGSYVIVLVYLTIYLVWGLYLGVRISTLDTRSSQLIEKWNQGRSKLTLSADVMVWDQNRNRNLFWLVYLFILLFMTFIIAVLGQDKANIFYVVFRSMAAIFLVFWVINPLFNYWIKSKTQQNKLKDEITRITHEFSILQRDYTSALQIIGGKLWLPMRYIRAMELLIVVRLWVYKPNVHA